MECETLLKPVFGDEQIAAMYRLLSVPMIDFDCARLCAPDNDGIPLCCDPERSVPLLFTEEFAWHEKRSPFWRRMPRTTDEEREFAEEFESEGHVLALCPGPARCVRARRSLVCRTYPFEPHVDPRGKVLGLTYNFSGRPPCPLTRERNNIYHPAYIRNSILFWTAVLRKYPAERELYIEESEKIRARFARRGEPVPLFS